MKAQGAGQEPADALEHQRLTRRRVVRVTRLVTQVAIQPNPRAGLGPAAPIGATGPREPASLPPPTTKEP